MKSILKMFGLLVVLSGLVAVGAVLQRSVTCDMGRGGEMSGDRWMLPEQDGQLRAVPFRSFAIRCSACAGL